MPDLSSTLLSHQKKRVSFFIMARDDKGEEGERDRDPAAKSAGSQDHSRIGMIIA